MTTFKDQPPSSLSHRLRAAVRAVRVLLAFGFRAGPAQWTALLLVTILRPITGLAVAYAAKLLTDAVLQRGWDGVLAAAALAAAGQIAQSACELTYLRLTILSTERAGELLDRHLVELIARIPGIAHFERADYADEVALVRSQRGLLAETSNAFILNIQVWVGLLASAALLYRLHPAMVLLPLFGLGSAWTGHKVNAIAHARDEANAERDRARGHVRTLAITDGPAKELRVFGLEQEMIRRYLALAESMHRVSRRAAWRAAGYEILGSLCFAVGYVGSLALALRRAMDGALTPGDVVLAVALAAQMNGTLAGVVGLGNYLGRATKAASRYIWLADYAAAARRVVDSPATVPQRLERGIALEGLTFRYPGTDALVLDNVSLELPAGSVVAIVGENGAGKTTLVKLLSRFYEPDAGRVTVDGVDLRRFDVDEWRARLTAGYQDFSRFELLAGQTVGVGDLPRVADTAAIDAALERASAADVTALLPRGLETQLGKSWNDGVELSGGQWQKLALARALMRTAPLVVAFDEPTAALDAQTEHALFERFAAAARSGAGRVTVLISHRFSTVRMADLIVVLDKGKIVEQGSHADLMARAGLYAELYSLQAAAYS